MNRRQALKLTAAAGLAGIVTGVSNATSNTLETAFKYCLNTSTISGQKPGLEGYIKIASKVGYEGVELWVRDVKEYLEKGNSAASLKSFIEEHGITVEGAIGFAPWLKSKEGMQQMGDEMELMKSIGCKRIAAPASGFKLGEMLDVIDAGEKFRELLEMGDKIGIQPCLEFWGASPVLSHMGQVLQIAALANHPNAKILADVYHMFRGGSGFDSLKLINGNALELFHVNDYSGDIPRMQQTDSDRVFPGDGVAPLLQILGDLKNMGGEKVLSLELFNPEYWKQDAETVAKTGLLKLKAIISKIP